MSKTSRSIKSKNFRVSAIQANRQRIGRNADADEIERQRLVRLNKQIQQAQKPVITI